jgi:peptidoglycan-associated lipoprotein
MKKAALFAVIAILAAACASNEPKKEAAVTDKSTGVQPPSQAQQQPTTQPRPPAQPIAGNPLTDPGNILSKRSVFFDFDSNAVKDEYRGMIQAHSRYMTADKKDSRIRIEGNCDERGSREYNLALGQRRAEAVTHRPGDVKPSRGIVSEEMRGNRAAEKNAAALGDSGLKGLGWGTPDLAVVRSHSPGFGNEDQ